MKPGKKLCRIFALAAASAALFGINAPLAQSSTAQNFNQHSRRMIGIGDSIAQGVQTAGHLGGGICPYDAPPLYFYNNRSANMHGGTCISRPSDAILNILKYPTTYLPGVNLKGADVILSTGLSNETYACKNGSAPIVKWQLAALKKDGVKRVAVLGTSVNGHTYYGVPLNPMNACLKNEVAKFSKAYPGFVRFVGPITHTENTPQHIHPANYYEVLRQAKKTIASIHPPAPVKHHKISKH